MIVPQPPYERITPDAYRGVEERFDAWCDDHAIRHAPWGAAAENRDTREWLREEDTWQRNRADRILLLTNRTQLLVDIKSTTSRNGKTGNVSIEMRTLWAAEMERPKWTVYAVWHESAWWYLDPFDVVVDAIWACCDSCWARARRHDWAALPTKCPDRVRMPGSGDPHVVVKMDHARAFEDLLRGRLL